MIVLIVGTGTIGKPLIRLALEMKNRLRGRGEKRITEVIFVKNTPNPESRGWMKEFHEDGAKIAVYEDRAEQFRALLAPCGFAPDYTFEEALVRADIVVDCTEVALDLKRQYYSGAVQKYPKKVFIAQGSAHGFGLPYAYDINDRALYAGCAFIQVVSCNTHQILSLIKTLGVSNVVSTRIHIARRGADISQGKSTVGVNVSPPTDARFGTHQAKDAAGVLATVYPHMDFDIHSTCDVHNNPFMHVPQFRMILHSPATRDEIEDRFRANPLVAVTYQTENNQVFSEGRERGSFGRILNQTVVCLPSLEIISGGCEVVGRCFTPQDGNSLLSSAAAILWAVDKSSYRKRTRALFYRRPFIFDEV